MDITITLEELLWLWGGIVGVALRIYFLVVTSSCCSFSRVNSPSFNCIYKKLLYLLIGDTGILLAGRRQISNFKVTNMKKYSREICQLLAQPKGMQQHHHLQQPALSGIHFLALDCPVNQCTSLNCTEDVFVFVFVFKYLFLYLYLYLYVRSIYSVEQPQILHISIIVWFAPLLPAETCWHLSQDS